MELRINGSEGQLRRRRFRDGSVLLGGGRRVGSGFLIGDLFEEFGAGHFDERRFDAPAQQTEDGRGEQRLFPMRRRVGRESEGSPEQSRVFRQPIGDDAEE